MKQQAPPLRVWILTLALLALVGVALLAASALGVDVKRMLL